MLFGLGVDLYLQIRRGWISLTNLTSRETFATSSAVFVPVGAAARDARFATPEERARADAAGWKKTGAYLKDAAGEREGVVLDGFGHPRLLIGDFHATDVAFRLAWKRIRPKRGTGVRGLLVHLQDEEPEGGVTTVEMRTFRDLSTAVGARRVRIYLRPRELAPEEARRLIYVPLHEERDLALTD